MILRAEENINRVDRSAFDRIPMSADTNIYENVISYFENEFGDVKRKLEEGDLDDFKERVLVSQKITEALHLLSPYVRTEWRARQLVKDGEKLKKELLSVRDMIKQKPLPVFVICFASKLLCGS